MLVGPRRHTSHEAALLLRSSVLHWHFCSKLAASAVPTCCCCCCSTMLTLRRQLLQARVTPPLPFAAATGAAAHVQHGAAALGKAGLFRLPGLSTAKAANNWHHRIFIATYVSACLFHNSTAFTLVSFRSAVASRLMQIVLHQPHLGAVRRIATCMLPGADCVHV